MHHLLNTVLGITFPETKRESSNLAHNYLIMSGTGLFPLTNLIM